MDIIKLDSAVVVTVDELGNGNGLDTLLSAKPQVITFTETTISFKYDFRENQKSLDDGLVKEREVKGIVTVFKEGVLGTQVCKVDVHDIWELCVEPSRYSLYFHIYKIAAKLNKMIIYWKTNTWQSFKQTINLDGKGNSSFDYYEK